MNTENPAQDQENPTEDEQHLSQILGWIGNWNVAGFQAVAANFGFTPERTASLLQTGWERELIAPLRVTRDYLVYRLTARGAAHVGIEGEFRILRRNIVYLSRRSHVAALLLREMQTQRGLTYEVVNPRELGSKLPTVRVDCGGVIKPWRPDVVMKQCGESRDLTVVVMITDYQSRRTSESMCNAWHAKRGVRRVIFCAIPDVLADLRRLIDGAQFADKLAVMELPPSDYTTVHIQRKTGRQERSDRMRTRQRAREAKRRAWAQAARPFRELTDAEWRALDPLLQPGRPKKPRHWMGTPINEDRDVVNTILLAIHLGRPLHELRLSDGYSRGGVCVQRIRQWRSAGVWSKAWETLAEMSPERELNREFTLVRQNNSERRVAC